MFRLNCFRLKSAYLSNMKNPHVILEDTKLKNSFFGIFTSTQGLQFTNQCVFSFRFTNLLVYFFRSPSRPCGLSCREGATRKDAWWLNYFAFVQPLFPLYKIYLIIKINRKQKILAKYINISKNQIWNKYILYQIATRYKSRCTLLIKYHFLLI